MKPITFILLTTLLLSVNCSQSRVADKWKDIFEQYNITGTFVLKNLSTQEMKIYDQARSEQRFVPASTFKILNSMIALQTGVINRVEDTIRWDGTKRGLKSWNRDHTMRSAISVSCVWFYQELARRIGREKMSYWLEKADYGNKKIENRIDKFWLEGELSISAIEQVDFIQRLIKNDLPFDSQIQEVVKEIILTDANDEYTTHAKTGWSQKIGWYVGYIETKKDTWIFAMNMDMEDIQKAKYRKIITNDILKAEGIIK